MVKYKLRTALSTGVNYNQPKSGQFSDPPLTIAVKSGHVKIVELLLKNGAKVNVFDYEDTLTISIPNHRYALTDLLHSKRNGHINDNEIQIIALLLEYKADLYWPDAEDNTPLTLALGLQEKSRDKVLDWSYSKQ